MLGLSMTEIVIVLGLALLLLGPDQLPSIAKALGKGMREIRKATDDLKTTFEQEMVRIDEPEQRMLQPVSGDPAAARASARTGTETPADPAAARAAARRAAAGPDAPAADSAPPEAGAAPPALRLVAGEGSVPREAAKPAEAEAPPQAPPGDAAKDAT